MPAEYVEGPAERAGRVGRRMVVKAAAPPDAFDEEQGSLPARIDLGPPSVEVIPRTLADPPPSVPATPAVVADPPRAARSVEALLIEKFPAFDPTWPESVQTQWFQAFERLTGIIVDTNLRTPHP